MRWSVKNAALIVAAGALVAGSTGAAAAPALPSPAPAPSAWMMLSALGPSRAVALGGANAAVQPADMRPDQQRPYYQAGAAGAHVTGEFLPFILWFALVALALTNSGSTGRPNTPN